MSKYIDAFLSSIPDGQRQILQSMLDVQKSNGQIATTEEYQAALALALSKIQTTKDFTPSFSPEKIDEDNPSVISSAGINKAFEQIIMDLGGLYNQLEATDNTIQIHDDLRKADWARIRDAINKVTEDLVRHRTLKTSSDWQDVKYIDFWNNRVGESTARAATIDPQTKKLTLAIKSNRRIEQQRGGTATLASVTDISAVSDIGSSRSFWPENALDNSDKTFWAHLILTDGTLNTTWDGTEYNGAIVSYVVTFANAEFLNYVSFLPYAKFPLTLIDLQYRDGETWSSVPGFSALSPTLDWAEFRFQRIQANALRFIFLQPNYVRNKYLVPRNTFTLARLWDQVVDEELLMGIQAEDLTSNQQMQIETNPRFRSYLFAMKQVEDRLGDSGIIRGVLDDQENMARAVESVTRVLAEVRSADQGMLKNVIRKETDAPAETDNTLIEVDKYEYLFGLRSIKIHDTNYMPIGIYRSPEFTQRALPYGVSVEVTESRVALDAPEGGGATYYKSSAEYEIEIAPERKVNILPYGQSTLTDELCVIDPRTLKGTLRFTPGGAVVCRASGSLLTSGVHFSVSGRVLTILSGWSPNYIYTCSYTPTGSPTLMDIDSLYNSIALERPEVFDHTDKDGMVDLTYYPFVAYEIVNHDTKWAKSETDAIWSYRMPGPGVLSGDMTVDGITYGNATGYRIYTPITVTVNGAHARNITNYRTREHPGFVTDPSAPQNIEYIHVGKRLYFSRPLTDATIEVQYRWIAQYIKLNIYLRAHGFVVNSYTPTISNAKILIRSGL